MVDVSALAWQTLALLLAPLMVAVLLGIDRKLTARMQNRVGPPILQPFYDIAKLFGKERKLLNPGQVAFALASLLFQAFALATLAYGGDLILAFFLNSAASLFLVLGAFSVRSPFSHMGAQRELLQVLAYEPVLFLVILSMAAWSGNFSADQLGGPLLYVLPLAFLAMLPILVIKMQKSPYDIAHAHTELVSGPQVEYSGSYLGVLVLVQWVELAFLLWVLTLFWTDDSLLISLLGKLALVIAAIFFVILLDNSTTRLTRARMVTFTLSIGISLVVINILVLFYLAPEVGW
jgi:ech hydrogenase subunit B